MEEGNWKAFKVGKKGILVSHLMFADVLLLFKEATVDQLHCVTRILNQFCKKLGQQVSQEKTKVYFSKNVTRNV